jgi:radical SAM superfamily enzyme YgiQ (UPF0313 family)
LKGKKIVLTSDKAQFLDVGHWYYPYVASMQIKNNLANYMSIKRENKAPLSLRAVEAFLIRKLKLSKRDCQVTHPNHLKWFIGKNTKIVGISALDPLGLGPVTKTLQFVFGGGNYLNWMFEDLMNEIRILQKKFNFKIVVGGPGAWQVEERSILDQYGIDYLVIGEAESILPELLNNILLRGENNVQVIKGNDAKVDDIPPLVHSTVNGIVEVTRGCGRNCVFCTSSSDGFMRSLPLETIIESVKVNLREGEHRILLQSDDFLLYGTKRKFVSDPTRLFTLIEEIKSLKNVRQILPLHLTYSSIVYNEKLTESIFSRLPREEPFIIQIGLETGSVHLAEKYLHEKVLPFSPEEWPEVIKKAIELLSRNDVICLSTLIVGFPDESTEDINETISLLKTLEGYPLIIIPMIFTPLKYTHLSEENTSKNKLIHLLSRKEYLDLFHEIRKINAWLPKKVKRQAVFSKKIAEHLSLQELCSVWTELIDSF